MIKIQQHQTTIVEDVAVEQVGQQLLPSQFSLGVMADVTLLTYTVVAISLHPMRFYHYLFIIKLMLLTVHFPLFLA